MSLMEKDETHCKITCGSASMVTTPVVTITHGENGLVIINVIASSNNNPSIPIDKYIVDWGDGSDKLETTDTEISHTYSIDSVLPILLVSAIDVAGNKSNSKTLIIDGKWITHDGGALTTPTLSTKTITMDESTNSNVTITNFDSEHGYEITADDKVTITRNNEVMTITASSVTSNVTSVINIRAVKDGLQPSEWVTVVIGINNSKTTEPVISTVTVNMNENSSSNIDIDNYNPDYTYEFITGNHFTVSNNNGALSINSSEVTEDITESLSVRATGNNMEPSNWVSISINIHNLPVVDDQVLTYNNTNMTEFTTLTNAMVNNGFLVATADNAIAISNVVTQEEGESDFKGLTNLQITRDFANLATPRSDKNSLVVYGQDLVVGDILNVDGQELEITDSILTSFNKELTSWDNIERLTYTPYLGDIWKDCIPIGFIDPKTIIISNMGNDGDKKFYKNKAPLPIDYTVDENSTFADFEIIGDSSWSPLTKGQILNNGRIFVLTGSALRELKYDVDLNTIGYIDYLDVPNIVGFQFSDDLKFLYITYNTTDNKICSYRLPENFVLSDLNLLAICTSELHIPVDVFEPEVSVYPTHYSRGFQIVDNKLFVIFHVYGNNGYYQKLASFNVTFGAYGILDITTDNLSYLNVYGISKDYPVAYENLYVFPNKNRIIVNFTISGNSNFHYFDGDFEYKNYQEINTLTVSNGATPQVAYKAEDGVKVTIVTPTEETVATTNNIEVVDGNFLETYNNIIISNSRELSLKLEGNSFNISNISATIQKEA